MQESRGETCRTLWIAEGCVARAREVALAAAHAEFAEMFEDATVAGRTAAAMWVVRPMFVQCEGYVELIEEGEFGHAWVWFEGNTPFGRWAKRSGRASRMVVRPGLIIYVDEYGAGVQRNFAYARAFAASLNASGIRAEAEYRLT